MRPILLLGLIAALLSGCAALPPRAPVAPQHALADVGDTPLARIAAASLADDPAAPSGFRLLPEGEGSFNARIALMRRATRSIDAQYYYLGPDEIGLAFLRELRDAAARGVRVRLIVDDLYTATTDTLLAALAAHANVQVRAFNPLPARSNSFGRRLLFSLHELSRINHRMHNKLLVADNRFAVSGGRNIGNEYFMRSAEANFIDLDVLSAGAVVQQFSAIFDDYWNSEQVWPIGQLAGVGTPPEAARAHFDERVRRAPAGLDEREQDVLGAAPLAQQLDAGRVGLVAARARAFADTPAKAAGLKGEAATHTVTEQTLALFAQAREQVNLVSPYFIPGQRGMALIRAVGATQENGRISLVTNALGATDEPLVHAGYARYREEMLRAGVRIYEVSPTLTRRSQRLGNFGRSLGRLHAKVAIIDHRTVFIGSMNLDARSAYFNTEIGLAIESPELAAQLTRLFRDGVAGASYRLRLGAGGSGVEWLETEPDGHLTVHTREPDDGVLLRLKQWLLAPFVSDELL